MAQQQQQDKKIGFKTILLCKDQTLGIGSYGAVCKAKCDDLICAAKIIHPTLFDPTALHQIAPHREHRLPMMRFQLECEFLSTVRHPNIIQYLGTHQDSDTGLPVLLMELMDESLTHFLESSTQPIPYHIQVNICHDITLALLFLHSNGIVHRDLSSNNVLLISRIRAKLTDFGMARIGDLNHLATHVTNTMCPGTDVYMPPEAVQDKPVYTEKIDCFSFGVLTVQTLTRQFPKPGDRMARFDDPRFPQGTLRLCVPEKRRRQNHISQVDPNHPLLPIALDCLNDKDIERPSAQQLCERVAVLKQMLEYKNSREKMKDGSCMDEECEQIESLQQKLEEKNQAIDQKDAIIAEKDQQMKQCKEKLNKQIQEQNQQIRQLEKDKQRLERERNQAIQEKVDRERQLKQVNKQLKESEHLMADLGKRSTELEEHCSVRNQTRKHDIGANTGAVSRTSIRLRWREGENAPCEMYRCCDAVIYNSTVYCKYDLNSKMYAYHIPSSNWSPIPYSPYRSGFAIAVIDGLLTTIGGYSDDDKSTNKLFSLTRKGTGQRWTEKFPPMSTKRSLSAALCTGSALIVAGGNDDCYQKLKTVEVLNTKTRQWHIASDLPEPLDNGSLVLCCDLVYLLWGPKKNRVSTCSLTSLLSSAGSRSLRRQRLLSTQTAGSIRGSIWNNIAHIPVSLSSCVTFRGQQLAIGGKDSNNKPTTAVHVYQPTTNSWEVISHMTIPRSYCLTVVLPNNQLMVVGGWTTDNKKCDSVELGRVI